MAAKGAGCLGWIVLSFAALTWCVPRDRTVDSGRGSAPQPLFSQPLEASRPTVADRERSTPPLPNSQVNPVARRTMYATARVNIRQAPSTTAAILGRLEKGQEVTVTAASNAWHRIESGQLSGWVHGEYLSSTAPRRDSSRGAPPIQAPLARALSGRPIREPYTGICDCPYDYKRNGARCGGTSAYSRPGGREPECYE